MSRNLNPNKDLTGKRRHVRVRRLLGPDLIGLELEYAVERDVPSVPDAQLTETDLKWIRATVDSIFTVHKALVGPHSRDLSGEPTGNYSYREARLLDGRRCVVLVRQFKGHSPSDSNEHTRYYQWWEDVPYRLPLPESFSDGKPAKPKLNF